MSQPHKPMISPSILSADFAKLGEEISEVERGGCDWIHVDVMDGHFVPNLTIGPPVVKWIRKATALPLDVHLMIEEPAETIEQYARAGADWITVHVEACRSVDATLQLIRKCDKKVGLTLKPKTSVDDLMPYLDDVDLVLIMTVEPGFGGQSFMPEPLEKIRRLRRAGFKKLISVDGGINAQTAVDARKAGADVFVAGKAIFSAPERRSAIRQLQAV